MTRPGRYPAEMRERAVPMVFLHRKEYPREYPSEWAAIKSIAERLGVPRERPDLGARSPG